MYFHILYFHICIFNFIKNHKMSIQCTECYSNHESDKICRCLNCSSYICTLCSRKCISCENYVCIPCCEDNIMKEFKKTSYSVKVPGLGLKRVQNEEIHNYLKMNYQFIPITTTYYKCCNCCEIT